MSSQIILIDFNCRENKMEAKSIKTDFKLIVENVRNQFLLIASNEPDHFDQRDMEMVKSNDWWTERFVKVNNGNERDSLNQMLNAFRWRKSFGVNDRALNDAPHEFIKGAAMFPHGFDHKSRPVVYLRAKMYQKIQRLNTIFQQFATGIIEHVDRLAGRKGFVIVFDSTGMGWRNFDIDFLQFIHQLFQHYYPCGVRSYIVYNLPKMLRPIWKLSKLLVGSSIRVFHFCNSAEELSQFIPNDNILYYMGGESYDDFTEYEGSQGAPMARQLAPKLGYSKEEVDKFFAMFEEQIRDTEKLLEPTKKR